MTEQPKPRFLGARKSYFLVSYFVSYPFPNTFPIFPTGIRFGFLFRFLNRQETANRFLTMYVHIVETSPLARRFRTCFPYFVYCHKNQASGRLLPNLTQRRTARKEVVRQKPSRGIDSSA